MPSCLFHTAGLADHAQCMFPSTLSVGSPDSLHASTLLRNLAEAVTQSDTSDALKGSLSPSLVDDLRRFERNGIQTELIEVVAASLRHSSNLLVRLSYGGHDLPLSLFPAQRLMYCPLVLPQLLSLRLTDLLVLGVQPAGRDHLADHSRPRNGTWDDRTLFASLDLLSWDLAMRGARSELLPEIPTQAAFRIPPGVSLQGFDINGTITAALHRLKRSAANLKDISAWAGFDRERATRLLNALYLQSALMATRSHPAAGTDVWS